MAGLPVPGLGTGSPVVWGVLNVTPDSFSDGGRFVDVDRAVAHGRLMREQGADVIDVGGESTRPGARRIGADEEKLRVLPVVEALAAEGMTVSVDTMRSEVAIAAVDRGAGIVNDVSGGRADPAMHRVVAGLSVHYVVMHWRGHSEAMDDLAVYEDPVRQVRDEIEQQVAAAVDAGIDRGAIIIDPGIGFAKNSRHNWSVLRSLGDLGELGFPVLVGASRKRFLGELLADPSGEPRNTGERDVASAALSTLLAQEGSAWGLRVHDVESTMDALKVVRAMGEESS